MNNLPRQVLRQILAKHGRGICSDARRCENLLNDWCGAHRRETNVLVTAIEEHVPLDLLAANRSVPLELLLNRLEKRLEEQTALTAEAARWAVESWALALDLTTESEIQARQKRIEIAAPPMSKTEKPQPNAASGGGAVPSNNRPQPIQPPRPSPTVAPPPVSPPRPVPPVMRQPLPAPPSAPPTPYTANNQSTNSPLPQSPPVMQSIARKGFGLLRGCLVVILLLAAASVVLFLGVPFAIEKMRETQRERNNEPPRFPIR